MKVPPLKHVLFGSKENAPFNLPPPFGTSFIQTAPDYIQFYWTIVVAETDQQAEQIIKNAYAPNVHVVIWSISDKLGCG